MDKQQEQKGKDFKFLGTYENIESDFFLEDEEEKEGSKILIKITALVTGAAFILMALLPVINAFKNRHPSAELFRESTALRRIIDDRLLEATVKIQVITDEMGIGMGEKTGTGFNINPKGLIVTNHHVIDNAKKIIITFPNGKTYRAKNWSSRPEYDLAVIELKTEGLASIPLNIESLPKLGETLLVIGNPLDFNNLAIKGELVGYSVLKEKPIPVMTMDLAIFPGNSGSPVFDKDGKVVGVVFGVLERQENEQIKTYGLAMPIEEILDLLQI